MTAVRMRVGMEFSPCGDRPNWVKRWVVASSIGTQAIPAAYGHLKAKQSHASLCSLARRGKRAWPVGTIAPCETWFLKPATAVPLSRKIGMGVQTGMLNEELSQLIEQEIPRLRRYGMFLARD